MTPRDLAIIWNNLTTINTPKEYTLPQVFLLTFKSGSQRWRYARARLKDEPDEDFWIKVILRICKSNFCLGKSGRGWRATFDFLIRPETHIKVMEGQYDNIGPGNAPCGIDAFEEEIKRT